MEPREQPIGVFDSGLGGISVLRACVALLPQENFLFFGDSANAPYGEKSLDQVRRLTVAAADRLLAQHVKAIVVACNTATSAAIGLLRQTHPELPIIGIEPALKLAVERHPGGRILVMATEATLRERKFALLMEHYAANCKILERPCPDLVEFVERGELDGERVERSLRNYLADCLQEPPEAAVLGCTHFPFLRPVLHRLLGPQTELLDGAGGTARETKRRLEAVGLLRETGEGGVKLTNSLQIPELAARMRQLLTTKAFDAP